MRRRDLLTTLGAVALVPLSWETWRLGRDAWALTRPVPVVLSADETEALNLERALLTLLHDLGSLPAGTVDAAILHAVTTAHQDQLTALTDARGVGPVIVPSPGPSTTLVEAQAGQRALAEQAHAAALKADQGGYAALFAAIELGTREQMGVLK